MTEILVYFHLNVRLKFIILTLHGHGILFHKDDTLCKVKIAARGYENISKQVVAKWLGADYYLEAPRFVYKSAVSFLKPK